MHFRSRHYLVMLAGAAIIAVPVAFVTAGFVGAFKGLEDVLWEHLPDALDVDPDDWWPLVVTGVGGLVVGLMVRYVPGHGGPEPADGHGVGGDDGAGALKAVPGLLLIAIVSLGIGTSLGPEMPMMAATVTIGGMTTVALKLPREMMPAVAIAGIAALFGGLFGSPLLGVVLLLEMPRRDPDANPYDLILPALVGSTIGYFVFLALFGEPFAAYDLPNLGGVEAADVLWAAGVGAAGAAVGVVFLRFFRLLDRAFARARAYPVVLATAGGILLGIVAIVVGEETLFSGEHQLQDVIDAKEGLGFLVALILAKMLTLAVSLGAGFRGGRVFPLLFIGGTMGLALSQILSVPEAVSVPCGMVAVALPALRMPVLLIVIVAFFTPADALPLLVIAGIVSFLLCNDQPELRDAPEPESPPAPAPAPAPA
jgi:H+/Cl- antiporter ClcA